MNILFVNYGNFTTNSLNHIGAFANALTQAGHACVVAVPSGRETLASIPSPLFQPALFEEALRQPHLFPDGREANVIHAWTPRENVRKFVVAYQQASSAPARLVIHLEDNEEELLEAYTHQTFEDLRAESPAELRSRLPDTLAHPHRLENLLRLADAVTVIMDALREMVPEGPPVHRLFPGVDLSFYRPMAPENSLREELGLGDDERVITYTGSTSFANEGEMRELYLAVALLNEHGFPTRLIRTGFSSPQFRASLPESAAGHAIDLGVVPKKRLPALLAMADVLVQPGRRGRYNDCRLPSKIPEFLASGRPVIVPATNAGLLLRDGVDALLLHEGTPEEIAAACERVFKDSELAEKLGDNGRAFASRHFDLATNANALAGLYSDIVAAPPRSDWTRASTAGAGDLSLILEQTIGAPPRDSKITPNLLAQIRTLEYEAAHPPKPEKAEEETRRQLDLTVQHASNLEALVERSGRDLRKTQQHAKTLESQIQKLQRELKRAHQHAETLDALLESTRELASSLETALRMREDKIRRMQESFSWKLTAPLRAFRRLFTGARRPARAASSSSSGDSRRNSTISTDARAISPTAAAVDYEIDEPGAWIDLEATKVTIRGWLLRHDGEAVSEIQLRCGGDVFRARLNGPRADVKAAFPDHPHAAHSGFVIKATLPKPGGRLVLEQRDASGSWESFFSTPFTLTPDATDNPGDPYRAWMRANEDHSAKALEKQREAAAAWKDAPLISIILPVYNTSERWLRRAVESVVEQTYPRWELCIADDASTASHVRPTLEALAAKDSRIKIVFRPENGHISAASNSALELAAGGWIALLDHDDELAPDALFEVASALIQNLDTDLVYSDEDKIGGDGARSSPYFKPEFLPDLFTGQNFISHLAVYRASLVRKIGGFRAGYEGSQDWDLALRFVESTTPERIRHIPKILYHWRAIPGSTALLLSEKSYPAEAAQKALAGHLERTGQKASLVPVEGGHWRIRHQLPSPAPLVSLIIPTRNGLPFLRQCVESILAKTTYRNFEILIVDNASDDPATLEWLRSVSREALNTTSQTSADSGGIGSVRSADPALAGELVPPRHAQAAERPCLAPGTPAVRVLRDERPFNYSALNNEAVAQARGEFVALINNDLEVITPGWLEEMVAQAARPGVGCVGAMLYYPDDTIQHAGVILGVGGVAGHAFKRFPRGSEGVFNRARLVQNYSAVTAACLVVRKSIYQEAGGLGENELAVAFNDVDFCLKVRRAGYRNVWTPFAELYHHESASRGLEDTPEKHDRFRREIEVMKERWGELLPADPAYNPNLTLEREDFSIEPGHSNDRPIR
ncbi:MAG: glycosyltransferase [Opitutaceae bacterium]